MIIPIVAYGTKVLKQKAEDISSDYPDLEQLIVDMFETMYEASGVGLAAPQIGRSIRLFIVDGSSFADEDADMEGFRKVFINPQIVEESGEEWNFNEGCLSIPSMHAVFSVELFGPYQFTIGISDSQICTVGTFRRICQIPNFSA